MVDPVVADSGGQVRTGGGGGPRPHVRCALLPRDKHLLRLLLGQFLQQPIAVFAVGPVCVPTSSRDLAAEGMVSRPRGGAGSGRCPWCQIGRHPLNARSWLPSSLCSSAACSELVRAWLIDEHSNSAHALDAAERPYGRGPRCL